MCRFDKKTVLVLIQLQVLFIGGKWAKFLPSSSELQEFSSSLENICLTPGCVKAAAQILSNMNDTANPCDDFYQFACGGWQDRRIISDDNSFFNVIRETQKDINAQLKVLLDKPLTDDDPYFVKLLKTMLNSCLDVRKIESLEEKPLKTSLDNIGGWPVLLGNKWDESKFDWMDTLIKFRMMGFRFDFLFTISVNTDFKDNTKYTLELDEPSLGARDSSYYLNNSVAYSYFEYMVEIAIRFGVDKNVAKQELFKVFEFETNLAKINWLAEERRNYTETNNTFTIKQLQELSPKVDWLKVISGILGKQITDDELVLLKKPDFAKNLSKIISSTDKRTIANYLVWRIIPLLSEEWRDLSPGLGNTKESPRWEHCLSLLKSNLSVALSSYYVRNYFKAESKEAVEKIVGYILNGFIKIVEKADWLESGTRAKAVEKAKSMTFSIGYPNELRNDTVVKEYYAGLQLDEGSYYENMLKLSKFNTDKSFKRLWWEVSAAKVTNVDAAYNYPSLNTIVVSAGILKVLYFKDRPNYLNYGAFGYVIGHEITHGFDNNGKQYDKNGEINDWWDPESNERFNKKAQCLIDQYNKYNVEEAGENVNGSKTLGENIADNGGIREAYKAYHTWVAENGAEKSLPGLKYTPSQLFWISTANVWCAKYGSEARKYYMSFDTHSPQKYRIIGSLSNSQEFAQDFNCPSGSKMNPVNKCQVW